jgi:hypothetical protein
MHVVRVGFVVLDDAVGQLDPALVPEPPTDDRAAHTTIPERGVDLIADFSRKATYSTPSDLPLGKIR